MARISASPRPQQAPSRPSSPSGWTSLPAGMGVWVVNTMRSRTASHASRNPVPAAVRSAIIATPAKTA